MHRLLKRQLKRYFGDSHNVPEDWKGFIDIVNSTYHESDMDRNMLERSLELSSQELLQANSEMRAIFEVVPDIFFRIDLSGVILDCKTGDPSDLLVSRRNMIGKKIYDIPVPDISGPFRNAIEHIAQTGKTISIEYSLLLHETESFFEARFIPLLEDQAVIIIRNVTDRKNAENSLKKSEEFFREITLNSNDALFILDHKGRFTYVSPSTERFTGYRSDELAGRSALYLIDPEDHTKAIEDFAVALKTKDVLIPHVFRIRHKNGTELIMEGVGNNLLHNPVIAGFVLNARDATDHKRAEDALRESEERYRTIFESKATANIIIAEDTTIIMANQTFADLSGYTKQDLEKRMSWTVFIHKDDLERMVTYHRLRRMDTQTAPAAYEFRFINRQGSVLNLYISIAVIPETKVSVASLIDLTERKQLETQLISAQKMDSIGRLAGGVAHDFNNMLSVIIGNTEMTINQVEPSSPVHKLLQDILNAATRSADLTRQLLAFARKQAVSPRVLDLNDTITGIFKILQRLIGENIEIAWNPGYNLWKVRIDPSQVDQILANLMVNARDAIVKAGRIMIETANVTCDDAYCADRPEWIPGDYVVLSVSDDGCGMGKEMLESIFEPFFTTKKEGQGTGLGLATVYGIVKQNNGFINVYSESLHGTTFRLYFPRHVHDDMEVTQVPSETEIQGGSETILIVEDEETVLKLSKSMLETLGYRVLAAGNKDQALQLAGEHSGNIDLLLTDVVMPDINGKELSERIAAIRPNVKCLFMSGYTADVIARQGVLEEGLLFISKPFSLRELAARVRDALGR